MQTFNGCRSSAASERAHEPKTTIEREPLVSIIVPTSNSGASIGECLKSLRSQNYPNIEIIVVDNYSRDKTKLIASQLADVWLSKGLERSAQVNFGVSKARGEYVYRVDSDFLVRPDVIREAVYMCEGEGFDALCVPNTSDPRVSFWAAVRKLERDSYVGDKLNVAARFVRKHAFEKVGGFKEDLVAGEDYDFHNRLLCYGFRIGELKAGEIHIGEPKSLAEIAKKHYYYGKTFRRFIASNGRRGLRQIMPIRPAFIRNRKSFAKHPILALGFCLYQVVRYSASTLGLFSSYFEPRVHMQVHSMQSK